MCPITGLSENMPDVSEIPVCKTYLYLHSVHDSLSSVTGGKYTVQALCAYAGHCIPLLLCGMLIYIGEVPLSFWCPDVAGIWFVVSTGKYLIASVTLEMLITMATHFKGSFTPFISGSIS